GNNLISTIRSSKTITVTARDALMSPDYLALTQGVDIEEDGTANVTRVETLDAGDAGAVTLSAEAAGPVTFTNDLGEQVTAEATGTTATLTGATGMVEVSYPTTVTGDIIRFMADKFSEAWELELETIAYDPDTNQISKSIFFQFDKAIPAGDFDLSLEAGTATAPELTLNIASDKGNKELGRMIITDYVG